MPNQISIQKGFQVVGVGVHSGRKVHMQISPAPVNTGIVFTRTECKPEQRFYLRAEAVAHTMLNTGLVNDAGYQLSTVEHLLAAISGLGVDNLYIDIDGEEVPIMDGSAMPFIFLFKEAGLTIQEAPKKFLRVKREIRVEHEDKYAVLRPHNGFRVDARIDFNHPVIKQSEQHMVLDINSETFIQEVSRARTFGFMRDIEYLHEKGLALGGGLENAVVFDQFRVLNPTGLRYDNEMVRHKVLDAIGDLRMCGYNMLAELKCYKPGHQLNNILLRKLMATTDAWEVVTADEILGHNTAAENDALADLLSPATLLSRVEL